ncbi:MAG: HAD family hydrolase [Oscillospiraceae bacterium]|nr:HAD family hydrolase [Oscillospiraceae bacterium]
MIKTVIFDLDGTLVNSLGDLADSVNYGLTAMGYETYPTQKYKQFVGSGTLKLCERALRPYTADSDIINKLHGLFSQYYTEHCLDKTAPYDYITDALIELKKSGIKLAVASNKPDAFTRNIVTGLFGNEIFDCICGKVETRHVKPYPDIVLDILSELGTDREDTIIAGDSDVDIATAANAGILSIGCLWGFRDQSELEDAGADYIAKSPCDIPKIIRTIE